MWVDVSLITAAACLVSMIITVTHYYEFKIISLINLILQSLCFETVHFGFLGQFLDEFNNHNITFCLLRRSSYVHNLT